MLFIAHRLQAYFLKITGRWPPFISMHCCKRVWKLPYMRLRRSSSVAATSSTVACLSSWIVMIRHWNTRSYRNPHRKKSGTVRSGDRAGQAMSPKREITVPNVSRTTAILFRTIWNGVLSSTVPLPANHDNLARRRDIQIRNVSVGSAPPCIIRYTVKKKDVCLCVNNVCYMQLNIPDKSELLCTLNWNYIFVNFDVLLTVHLGNQPTWCKKFVS